MSKQPTNNRQKRSRPQTKRRQPAKPSALIGTEVDFLVESMSQEGRGVARFGCLPNHEQLFAKQLGKKVFINNALVGETVTATITTDKKSLAEANCVAIENPSAERVTPACKHVQACGGCQLQHISTNFQVTFKEDAFKTHLSRSLSRVDSACTESIEWLPALTSPNKRYRRKVRLGVRMVHDKLIIGFREPQSNRLTAISDCTVLHPAINARLTLIKDTFLQLSNTEDITHLEIVAGESAANSDDNFQETAAPVTMLIRHLSPFTQADNNLLTQTFKPLNWQVLSQAQKGAKPSSVSHEQVSLSRYHLPAFNLTLGFDVQDFIQVNADVNQQMVAQAMQLLDLNQGDTVVDLFCGLGNFSLAMAKQVGKTGQVIGIEGSKAMVKRAHDNALNNDLSNCKFLTQDLSQPRLDKANAAVFNGLSSVSAVLLDPPRAGAKELLPLIATWQAPTIVYISCNIATIVRDAVTLASYGYKLTHAGIMDMFPQTEHTEVMVKFSLVG